MIAEKKELIKRYEAGELQELAAAHISNVAGVVLVEWDDEAVFGFIQVMDGEKDYFRRKLEYTTAEEPRPFFRVGSLTFYLDQFMRIGGR